MPTISAEPSRQAQYPCREYDSRRDAEAALHARARQRDRAQWQEPLGRRARFWTPNRNGLLSEDPPRDRIGPHLYVLDMFPTQRGRPLFGHPLGYIATDV